MLENQRDTNFLRSPSVLITGGSGLIGMHLTSVLLEKGYKVSHLSRNTNQFGVVRVHRWNPDQGILDPAALDGVDYIVHLAGENIGAKHWTDKRKEELKKSRIAPTLLLHKVIKETGIKLKAFISASSVGYYGTKTTEKIFKEEDPPSDDITGRLCREWEDTTEVFTTNASRVVKIRTAPVMAKNGSVLSDFMKPARYGFLLPMGSGQQFLPWIHIHDLCNIYIKAIEDKNINGTYNAVSPHHITNSDFYKTLSLVIKKPLLPFPFPAILLKIAYGEMSSIILKGSRVSSERIKNAGYDFVYGNLHNALKNLLTD